MARQEGVQVERFAGQGFADRASRLIQRVGIGCPFGGFERLRDGGNERSRTRFRPGANLGRIGGQQPVRQRSIKRVANPAFARGAGRQRARHGDRWKWVQRIGVCRAETLRLAEHLPIEQPAGAHAQSERVVRRGIAERSAARLPPRNAIEQCRAFGIQSAQALRGVQVRFGASQKRVGRFGQSDAFTGDGGARIQVFRPERGGQRSRRQPLFQGCWIGERFRQPSVIARQRSPKGGAAGLLAQRLERLRDARA
ncbi:MAG: hypothetical protein BWZ10_01406 [candidate division BRC1 bacterium ADurb.BinA364]|nr:MAG: hypothetical protein BWZ10_01406 [candidate division BRC1 bacterium ADurb.BinA364]